MSFLSEKFEALKTLVERKFDLVDPEASIAAATHEVTTEVVKTTLDLEDRVKALESGLSADASKLVDELKAKVETLEGKVENLIKFPTITPAISTEQPPQT